MWWSNDVGLLVEIGMLIVLRFLLMFLWMNVIKFGGVILVGGIVLCLVIGFVIGRGINDFGFGGNRLVLFFVF